MSIQFQSLEGRALFSVGLPVLPITAPSAGSLTSLLSSPSNILSHSFLSQMRGDLGVLNTKGTVPDATQLKNFNESISTALADGTISSGDTAKINIAAGSMLRGQGLTLSESRAINTDIATVLKSQLSTAQKVSFLKHFSNLETTFSKLKIS